jgi:hypothetical protein
MGLKAVGIIGTIAFIITSMACYQGAMRGVPWLGMAVFGLELLILLPLMIGKKQRLLITLTIGAIGLVLDTVLIAAGIYSVESTARWILPLPICPEWILALWLNFGLVMPNYLAMMRGRHIISALVGFVYAFIIYGGAARNNIIALPSYGMTGVTIIAIAWAVLMPFMYIYVGRLYQKWTTQKGEGHAQTK